MNDQLREAEEIAVPAARFAGPSTDELREVLIAMSESGRIDPGAVTEAARITRSIFPNAQQAADGMLAVARALREAEGGVRNDTTATVLGGSCPQG